MLRKLKLPNCALKVPIFFLQLIYLTLQNISLLTFLFGVDSKDYFFSTFIDKFWGLLFLLQTLLDIGNCIFKLNDAATRPHQHLMVVILNLIWSLHSQRIFKNWYLLIILIDIIIIDIWSRTILNNCRPIRTLVFEWGDIECGSTGPPRTHRRPLSHISYRYVVVRGTVATDDAARSRHQLVLLQHTQWRLLIGLHHEFRGFSTQVAHDTRYLE
jgi:hypothetical protein